jgi:hypothetical protein
LVEFDADYDVVVEKGHDQEWRKEVDESLDEEDHEEWQERK